MGARFGVLSSMRCSESEDAFLSFPQSYKVRWNCEDVFNILYSSMVQIVCCLNQHSTLSPQTHPPCTFSESHTLSHIFNLNFPNKTCSPKITTISSHLNPSDPIPDVLSIFPPCPIALSTGSDAAR